MKEGYLADLILVDGNPLASVKILQDPDNLLAVMKDGRFHKAPRVSKNAERKNCVIRNRLSVDRRISV